MATYPAPYLTQQNLTDRWGAECMRQLFDDTNTNTINTAGVASVISGAQAYVTARMPDTYDGVLPFPAPIPELIVEASFAYARYLAFPRNPDYFRALGLDEDKLLARAESLAKQIQAATLRLVDAPAPVPDNVGGDVESNDPDAPGGPFAPKPLFFIANMGDF